MIACSNTSLKLLFSSPLGTCRDETFLQTRLFYHVVDTAPSSFRMPENFTFTANTVEVFCFFCRSSVSLYLAVIWNSFRLFYQVWFILAIYRGCKWLLLTHFKVKSGALAGVTRSIFAHPELSVNKLAKFSLTVLWAAVCISKSN